MRDRLILVVREILRRAPLRDAIMDSEGYITRDSLSAAAASTLSRNSSVGTFSHDPFHGQGNAEVVQALRVHFKQLRDQSRDRPGFFETVEYLKIAHLQFVMGDPDDLDPQGSPILDPTTGLPRKKYTEHCVYTAKNVLERPGLLRSLERANQARLFGRPKHEGWLCNRNLERWLEQYEMYKAR